MTTSEKVAYLKGLQEGMNLAADSTEGKLFAKITEILEELASDVEDLQVEAADLRDYCDELDSDLGDVEEYLLDEAEGEDYYDDDYDEDEDEDWEDDYACFETECPACGETICVNADETDLEDVICPACGEHFTPICDGDCANCGTPCGGESDADDETEE